MNTDPFQANQVWRLLQAADPLRVQALAASLAQSYQVVDLQQPEAGLALLQAKDGAQGDSYFLGEFPLARAQVQLQQQGQVVAEGAALLLDDRRAQVRAIAILDGVLNAQLPGHAQVQQLLAEGAERLAQQQAERQAILQQTRVDFSRLGEES